MRLNRALAGLFLTAALAAPPVLGDLVKHKDWAASPEYQYLATDAEKKDWKNVKTDEDAEKFIALFWARRNPNPNPNAATPNPFRQRFETLVTETDKLFALGKKRGSLTERGKLVVLIGPPKPPIAKERRAGTDVSSDPRVAAGPDTESQLGSRVEWKLRYEKEQLPAWADVSKLEAVFLVDDGAATERVLAGASAVRSLEDKAAKQAIVHPDLKELQSVEALAAAKKAADEAATEAKKGPALSASVREVLEKVIGGEAAGPLSTMATITGSNDTEIAIQLLVPAAQVPAPETAKLAVLIRDKDGKDAARREEPALLQKSKGDYFADRAIPLPAGDYKMAVALVDAAGAPIVSAHRDITVNPVPTEFSASSIVLAYNDMPPEAATKPGDPFVISQRKWVAKSDNRFDASDSLAYAVRLYNPAIDPAKNKVVVKRSGSVKPKAGGAGQPLPSTTDENPPPEMKEGGVTILDLAADIIPAPEKLGTYFQPGEYVIKLTVTDATSGKAVNLTAPFTVVGGAPPPAPPKPAPKKKG